MARSVANLFGAATHAAVYSKFRPTTPSSILSRIIQYLGEEIAPPFESVIDVGCGNGQSTKIFVPHFKEITGIDVSEAQIAQAQKESEANIIYKVGKCETLPFKEQTIQLITGSQCHHWVDLPIFYKEVTRVLVPNGVLCLYFYALPQPTVENDHEKTTSLQKIVEHAYRVETKCYWDTRRETVDLGFEGIKEFPFRNVVRENLFSEYDMTLADYVGLVSTWSAYQEMKRLDEVKATLFIKKFEENMIKAMGGAKPANEYTIRLQLKYYLIMGRK